jgi:hypothetical protein
MHLDAYKDKRFEAMLVEWRVSGERTSAVAIEKSAFSTMAREWAEWGQVDVVVGLAKGYR